MGSTPTGTVILGDATEVLRGLDGSTAGLCYLDPPFLTQRSFVFVSGKEVRTAFNDQWRGGKEEYCSWLEELISEAQRILAPTGSIYVHLDPRVSHYVKVLLDKVFGPKNFRNEIIWKRQSSHNDSYQGSRFFGRIHDVILFYTKSEQYKWKTPYVPYDDDYLAKRYRWVEESTGRRYALDDLTAPGGPNKGNPRYPFLGVTRYWRYSKERMSDLLRTGKIVQLRKGGVPLRKRYLDEMLGKPVQDIWDDVNLVRGAEKTSYPTQKPLRLLERLIFASTDPGDIVVDPLCGSGTALIAAHRLGRMWFGVDNSREACEIAVARLRESGVEVDFVETAQGPARHRIDVDCLHA